MRPLMILLITALFLQACSLAAAPALTPTPADTVTPTQTRIPTSTFTVTPSPTIVHFPTMDFNATTTPNTVPIFTGVKTATPIITLTPQPIFTATPSGPGPGFKSITLSEHKLYWGICTPNKVKFTVEVDEPDIVYNVVLFVRLRAVKKIDYTAWNDGSAMDDHGDGLWTYTLYTKSIKDKKNYARSWIEYQIVATDKDGNFVGRSWIFTQSMTLQPCM